MLATVIQSWQTLPLVGLLSWPQHLGNNGVRLSPQAPVVAAINDYQDPSNASPA